MKKYLSGIIIAVLAGIAILPLQVFAAEDGEIRLNAEKKNGVEVSVMIPEAAGEKISSLQLGLQITDQDGNGAGADVLKQIESLSFQWNPDVQAKAKITEQRYEGEAGILRIYIAGTEQLFGDNGADGGGLALGTVTAAMASGGSAGTEIYISAAQDSFKMARGAEGIPVLAAQPDAVLLAVQETGVQNPGVQNPGVQKPGQTDPGDGTGENQEGTGRPGADKSQLQEVLNLAAGYLEADYTSESYALLKKAVKAGQAVLDDVNASQEEVDQAAEAIMNAVGSLVPAAITSVEERYGQDTLYAGQNQAVGTGDADSWQIYAAVIFLNMSVLAGAGLRKKYWKRI